MVKWSKREADSFYCIALRLYLRLGSYKVERQNDVSNELKGGLKGSTIQVFVRRNQAEVPKELRG
jgi:hypothetical protein